MSWERNNNYNMNINKLLLISLLIWALQGQTWVPYAILPSSQADNTYSLPNLVAGDEIQSTFSSSTSYYGNDHTVSVYVRFIDNSNPDLESFDRQRTNLTTDVNRNLVTVTTPIYTVLAGE